MCHKIYDKKNLINFWKQPLGYEPPSSSSTETCMVFWKLQQGPLGVDFVMERYGEHKCSPSHESRVESTIIKCFYSEPAESKSISDFCPPKILIHIVTKYNHASPFQQSIAWDCNSLLLTSQKPSTPQNRSRCQSTPSHSTHLTWKVSPKVRNSGRWKQGTRKEHTKPSTPESQRRRAEWRRRQAAAAGRTTWFCHVCSMWKLLCDFIPMVNYRIIIFSWLIIHHGSSRCNKLGFVQSAKTFQDSTSHQILWYIYISLNIDKNNWLHNLFVIYDKNFLSLISL